MIRKAIHRAFTVAAERNWDTVYWLIDMHGVVLQNTYERDKWVPLPSALIPLYAISARPDCKLIMWTSSYKEEMQEMQAYFDEKFGIHFDYLNDNPEVVNNRVSCFDHKPYFSVILDDKAGFDPATDWDEVFAFMKKVPILQTT